MFGSALQLSASTERCTVMADNGLVVARFWTATEVEEIAAFEAGFEAATITGAPLAVLVVIDEDAAAPSKKMRDALGKVLDRYRRGLVAWSGCVCGEGLLATSKRTMMRLIMTLGRIRCTWTVASRPEEAARWLAETIKAQLGHECDWQSWARALDDMRADRVEIA
jgi:hypothetical protein